MPELPEVQTTVKGLKSKVLNRTFVDVWSDWEKIVKKPKSFAQFKKEIKNKKIINVWRRAKNVVFDLSENASLLVHQKMSGHLLVGKWQKKSNLWVPEKAGPLNDKINSYIHLLFSLDNGQRIALSDARKFAKAELWKKEELLKELEKLGPEPLEENFTFDKFKNALLRKNPPSPRLRRGKVKQVLMDPFVIAGIGNIYSSEALWQAKINPLKDVSKLSEQELKDLYKAIKKVLQLGVDLGGESFSDYRNVEGGEGDFDTERKAYKREGQKCNRCQTAIKRIAVGGRSAFFCPTCQKL